MNFFNRFFSLILIISSAFVFLSADNVPLPESSFNADFLSSNISPPTFPETRTPPVLLLPEPSLSIQVSSESDSEAERGFSVMRRQPPTIIHVPPLDSEPEAQVVQPSPPAQTPRQQAPVQSPSPEPPASVRVAEPITQKPPREPVSLPVNPLPEAPSRISSLIEPKRGKMFLLHGLFGLLWGKI